jgi:hypothetical protein
MVAAQIRSQGIACGKPLGAVRDAQRSKPDHEVWVLKCDNATYRVSRYPDMAQKWSSCISLAERMTAWRTTFDRTDISDHWQRRGVRISVGRNRWAHLRWWYEPADRPFAFLRSQR